MYLLQKPLKITPKMSDPPNRFMVEKEKINKRKDK